MSSKKFSSAFVVTLLLSHAVLAPLTVIAQEQDASPQQVQEKNNSSLNESVSKNSSETSGDTSQDSVAQESNQTVTENIDMSEVPDESVDSELVSGDVSTSSETANETTSKAVSGDWEYTDDGIYCTITKYTGSATNIVIPTEIDGKLTKLQDITKEIFPNYASITSFSVFPSADGRKVPLVADRIGSGIISIPAFDADWGNLNSIDLSGLDVSSLTVTYKMFQNCKARSITLPDFSSGNVRDMSYMFQNAYYLTNLTGLSSFNTSNVTDMGSTFSGMRSLETLDVSHFDTSKV
uniref:BspA family leucine-rich repeat surface protein n=1 Tax=uncultured Streptococcus sp. TaxID=83427 RepID=UPI002594ABDA